MQKRIIKIEEAPLPLMLEKPKNDKKMKNLKKLQCLRKNV